MPDARCTRGPVRNEVDGCAHEHTGQRRQSDIPCAMALRLIRDLPGDRLFCHRRPRDLTRKLDASTGASGPHDFTVRFSAVRRGHLHVHRDPPNVVTLANAPEQDGMATDMPQFLTSGKAKYFLFFDLTRFPKTGSDLPVGLLCRTRRIHICPCKPSRANARPIAAA